MFEADSETSRAMKHDREMENKYSSMEPIENCRKLAANVLGVSVESTYCVTFTFTLGSYKALCSSSEMHDNHGHYIEVVYDSHKERFYVIHYEETERFTFSGV